MSVSGGGQRQSENSTSNVDPKTQAYIDQMRQAAQAAGQAGPSPLLTGAAGYNGGMMGAGQTGLAALSGDRGATQQLMDPYTQQVIGANNNMWQQMNAQTQNLVGDQATKAGAFGGSRQGVATGVALGQNNMAQGQQTAGLLSQGFNGAMDRAGQLAGMGFAGAGANANLGMGGVGSPQQWLMQMMRQGYTGPTGQTSSGAQSGTHVGFQFDPMKMFASAATGGAAG